MFQIRYVGFFHDRSYSSFGDVSTDGEAFFSLRDAKDKLRARVNSNGSPCSVTYPVCHDGMVATHVYQADTEAFICVTEDAFLDLYAVIPHAAPQGWGVVGEPTHRLRVGPRNGINTENF